MAPPQITIKLNRYKFLPLVNELMTFTDYFIDRQSALAAFIIWVNHHMIMKKLNGKTLHEIVLSKLGVSKEQMILQSIGGFKRFVRKEAKGEGEKQYTFKLNRKKFQPILEELNAYYYHVFETYSELTAFCIWNIHRRINEKIKFPDGSDGTVFNHLSESTGRSKEEIVLQDMAEFNRFLRSKGQIIVSMPKPL